MIRSGSWTCRLEFGRKSVRSQSWDVQVFRYKNSDLNVNRLIEIMKERRASDLHLRGVVCQRLLKPSVKAA